MPEGIDLVTLFGTVASTLQQNQSSLNEADAYNGDHGDNMVEIFEVITQAMKEKKSAEPADQLAYASQLLQKKKSGSAQMYAQGLTQASKDFKGQAVTQDNAMQLIQSLIGGGQAAPQQNPVQDLLGGLLGGGKGGDDPAIDAGDLLNAGLAFMAARNRGESAQEALVDAVISASPLGETSHRAESTKMVANTLLEVLGSMAGK